MIAIGHHNSGLKLQNESARIKNRLHNFVHSFVQIKQNKKPRQIEPYFNFLRLCYQGMYAYVCHLNYSCY